MKRISLFLAVLALVLWVYFNNRQEGVEVYTIDKQKDDLLQYVERDSAIDPEYIKTELEDMTKDKEVILIAYSLAKTDNRGELFDLIDTTL
jgi:septum formation topological specificity factor MinE